MLKIARKSIGLGTKFFLVIFLLVIIQSIYSVVSSQSLTDINESADDESSSAQFSCKKPDSKFSVILIVGTISLIVFAFVGILPAFFIRTDADEERFKNSLFFKCLLSFAAGSLLGDVFLHLLPETSTGSHEDKIQCGIYIIIAFCVFLLIEKISDSIPNSSGALGILNLISNAMDNCAHGTTVIGAFQISRTFGIISLISTVLHEIPHEFSDYALLLKSNFSRTQAIWLQMVTAMAGTIASIVPFILTNGFYDDCSSKTGMYSEKFQSDHHLESFHHYHGHHDHHSYPYDHHSHNKQFKFILPFTIGGFIYISLVGIIPDMIQDKNPKSSLYQMASFFLGILFIYMFIQFDAVISFYFA